MNKSQSSKLDEILIFIDEYTNGEGFLEPKYRKQAKSQILALIEEVIGNDEPVNMKGLTGLSNQYYLELDKQTRNELRAEMRLRKDAL